MTANGLAQGLGHRLQLGQRVPPSGPGVGQGARLVLPARPAVDREQEQPVVVLDQGAGPVDLDPDAGALGQPGAAPGGLGQLRPGRVDAAAQVDDVGPARDQATGPRPPRPPPTRRPRSAGRAGWRSAGRRSRAGRRAPRPPPRRRVPGRPGRPCPSSGDRTAASRPGRRDRSGGPGAARTRGRRGGGSSRLASAYGPGRAQRVDPLGGVLGQRGRVVGQHGPPLVARGRGDHGEHVRPPPSRSVGTNGAGACATAGCAAAPGAGRRERPARSGCRSAGRRRSRPSPSPGPGRTRRRRAGLSAFLTAAAEVKPASTTCWRTVRSW